MTNTYYPIVPWVPSEELISKMEADYEGLNRILTDREGCIAARDRAVESATYELSVLDNILLEMVELDRIQKGCDFFGDISEDDEDDDDSNKIADHISDGCDEDDEDDESDGSDAEERRRKGIPYHKYARMKSLYLAIMRVAHPDVTDDPKLRDMAVLASRYMDDADHRSLIILHAQVMNRKRELAIFGKLCSLSRRYIDLKELIDAVTHKIDELEVDYDTAKVYMQSPGDFLDAAKEVVADAICVSLAGVLDRDLTIDLSLRQRIVNLVPDAFERAQMINRNGGFTLYDDVDDEDLWTSLHRKSDAPPFNFFD